MLILSCSFLIIGCPNPILEQMLDPKKITFESNGGSHVDTQTIFKDQKISRPKDPARSGYNFAGWYKDNITFAAVWDFNTIPGGDMTLYAHWAPKLPFDITLSSSGTVNIGAAVGYTDVTSCTLLVNVTNSGREATGDLTIEISGIAGSNPSNFNLSKNTINSLNSTGDLDSFTVSPVTGLSVGVYTVTVRVYNNLNGISAAFNLTFNVGKIPITSAAISIAEPVVYGRPSLDSVPVGTVNFSILEPRTVGVTWAHGNSVFLTNTQYTVTIKLVTGTGANADYTFTGLSSATINGNAATISDNIGTEVKLSYTFAATAAQGVFTNINTIESYIGPNSHGNSVNDPIYLPIAFTGGLGNMTTSGSNWQELLQLVTTAGVTGKYVALDFSGCTMNGTEFNPDNMVSTGKYRIISLVLPNTALSTTAGTTTDAAFGYFDNLKSITGTNVETIGENAFYNNDKLTDVNFPKAETIGDNAFMLCKGLNEAIFIHAETIGEKAFSGCENLTNLNFPEVTTIGDSAFLDCSNLIEVRFPSAETLGSYIFSNCIRLRKADFSLAEAIPEGTFNNCQVLNEAIFPAAEIIETSAFSNTGDVQLVLTLREARPATGSNIFNLVGSHKTVIVKIPADTNPVDLLAYGYDDSKPGNYDNFSSGNWGADFKGGNANIELKFELY